MKLILNVGSGTGVLTYHSFIDNVKPCEYELIVYNMDLYTKQVHRVLSVNANAEYSNVTEKIDFDYQCVDIILAISPFNFSTINTETLRVLKHGGIFIILGNHSNKYLKNKDLIQSSIVSNVIEKKINEIEGYCRKIIRYIASTYVSHVTDDSRTTILDTVRIFKKL
ncbi:TPA: hypothetical protein ACIPUI_003872 [Citrobacter freundii]